LTRNERRARRAEAWIALLARPDQT